MMPLKNISSLAIVGFFACSALWVLGLNKYHFKLFAFTAPLLMGNEGKKLEDSGYYLFPMLGFMNRSLDKNAKVLSFSQNHVEKFTEINYLRHLDPRLLSFYQASTKEEALSQLQGLGITHVEYPGYATSVMDNSYLLTLLSDPHDAKIIYQYNGHRLHRINDEGNVVGPGKDIAQARSLKNWTVDLKGHETDLTIIRDDSQPHRIASPIVALPADEPYDTIAGSARIQGYGNMHVFIYEYLEAARPFKQSTSFSSVLYGDEKKILFQHQLDPRTKRFQVVYSIESKKGLRFEAPELTLY